MIDWKNLIACLPPGLSVARAARRLGKDYWQTRAAMLKHGYKRTDGRPNSPRLQSKFNWKKVNWRKSNIVISEELKCSRELVRRWRDKLGKPPVESRGRKPKNKTQ